MGSLNIYSAASIDEVAWPNEQQEFSLRAPALAFFTDFNSSIPVVMEATASAAELIVLLRKFTIPFPIFVQEKEKFIGVLCSDDLTERKIVQRVSQGDKRAEVAIKDLMCPKASLSVLDFNEVARATISQVIETLKNIGQKQSLVVDSQTRKIRGMFSAKDISSKLRLPIDIKDQSNFYKVFLAITQHGSAVD